MKRLAILSLLTVLIANLVATESRSAIDAPRFVSLEGRFSISLPDRFKQQSRLTIATPSGNAYGPLYEWQTKQWIFGVGYADAPQPISDPEAVKQLFAGATERFTSLVVASGGNIGPVKAITLDNHPGIEQRADVLKRSFIQRNYLVSRRIYQTLVVVMNSQRDESTAVGLLDTFKILNDAEITEEALKAGPGPLPQTPEAPRAGSDADDEGLRGPIKSIRTEIHYVSQTPFTEEERRSWLTTYNEKRNKVRTESYDFKNNLSPITVYGYLDGARVSAIKYVPREYGPQLGTLGGRSRPSNKKPDPRYQRRFEFKYDEKKRLIEQIEFSSNGDMSTRFVYKYEGNQKEQLVYLEDGLLAGRHVYLLDDKGNVIEQTDFGRDGAVRSKTSYTYEFDSHGNWIKRTSTHGEQNEKLRLPMPPSIQLRTITYY